MLRWIGVALVSLCCLVLPARAWAQGGPSTVPTEAQPFTLGIGLDRAFGDTRYTMNALTPNPRNPEELVPIASELVFPLDATLLGFKATWDPRSGGQRGWSLDGTFQTNVNDPSSRMTDSDFFGDKQIYYAESDADLAWIQVAMTVRNRLSPTWDLFLHLDYQRIEQHLVNFEGWEGSLFSDFRGPVSGTGPVLDYRVTYVSPQVGGAAAFALARRLRLGLEGSGGVVFASDLDDHLLRNRIAEGSGTGVGLRSRLTLDLLPGSFPIAWLSLRLQGELRFYHAEGTVDQWFYDDTGQPTGERTEDLAYEMESLQGLLGLSIMASF